MHVYELQNRGKLIIGGDFNTRCANVSDFIEGVDLIKDREVIDEVENSYCNLLMEFLISANFCILNGRLGKQNFTSISHKGRAVVDYICVPHTQLNDHLDFNVLTVSEMTDMLNLPLPTKLSQMPDHSVLITSLRFNIKQKIENGNTMNNKALTDKKYSVKNIPSNFMSLDNVNIRSAIHRIENMIKAQNNINETYSYVCNILTREMDKLLPIRKTKPNFNVKNNKLKHKPYWDEDLSNKWSDVCVKERMFLKHKGSGRQKLKINFVTARKSFGYSLRKAKRKYQQSLQDDLTKACNFNQNEFWHKVKNIGIHSDRKVAIPDKK